MGLTECYGCGKKFNNSYRFCPNCGRKKGASIEEMKDESTKEIENALEYNIGAYRKKIKDPSEILEVVKGKDKTTYEVQRKLTRKILRRFPEIKKRIKEDRNVEFDVFIITVPYQIGEDYLHHCMLEQLAIRNNNIANFSLGIQELTTDLFEVNVPIWIDEPFEETAIKRQFKYFKEAIPWQQKKFIFVAEPWYYINRVHDFDGRWINWKVLFKISQNEFKEFTRKYKEIPFSIQIFSDLKYAKHFSAVGTAIDGESFLGILEKGEKRKFLEKFRILETSFPKKYRPTLEMIRIDWELLKDLGFLNFSLQNILTYEPQIFTEHVSQSIMEGAKTEAAKFTKQGILRKKQDKEEILDIITDELINKASHRQRNIAEISKPIARNIRGEYRIFGDAGG